MKRIADYQLSIAHQKFLRRRSAAGAFAARHGLRRHEGASG
jgi:hypothetical protein